MLINRRFLHGALLCLMTLPVLPACTAVSSQIQGPMSTHYDVFPDRTPSISDEARARWRAQAELVIAQLAAGDSVDVYELHGRTIEASAVLSQGSYLPPPDPTLPEVLRGRKELAKLRDKVRAQLETSFASPVKTDGTDVVGFVERLRIEPGRRTRAVLFTDAVNETPDLDLAKRKLTEAGMRTTITDLARGRHWTPGRLEGVEVFFVLNGMAPSGKRPLNDRRTLQLFYAQLVGAMGGTVGGFDTGLAFPTAPVTMAQR